MLEKLLNFFGRQSSKNKVIKSIELTDKEKKEIQKDVIKGIEVKQRMIPVSEENLMQKGFALTGTQLKKYNTARDKIIETKGEKAAVKLPEKDPRKVQDKIIKETFKRLKVGHSTARVKLRLKEDLDKEEKDISPLKVRTLKVNVSPETFKKINPNGDEVTEIEFGKVRKSLRIGVKHQSKSEPIIHTVRNNADLKPQKYTKKDEGANKEREGYLQTDLDIKIKKTNPKSQSTTNGNENSTNNQADEAFENAKNQENLGGFLADRMAAKYGCEDFKICDITGSYPKMEKMYGSVEANGTESTTLERSNPTDTTSYHDFSSLQIAWEPIWSEINSLTTLEIPYVLRQILPKDFKFNDKTWLNYILYMDKTGEDWSIIKQHAARAAIEENMWWIWIGWGEKIHNFFTLPFYSRLAGDGYEGAASRAEKSSSVSKNYVGSDREKYFQPHRDNFFYYRSLCVALLTQGQIQNLAAETYNAPLTKELGYNHPIFTPESINYGIITTYRQTWKPINWQVGDLVSTIPLTAGESRKYTKRVKRFKKRSSKEIDKNTNQESSSEHDQNRAEQEILKRAGEKTNFEANAKGSTNIGVYNVEGDTTLNTSADKESKEMKKSIRDVITKAAREIKSEHSIEINTDESFESEITTTNEIRNPNDEITVTYLFYKLQRLFEISERLHQLEGVVLVANEVPDKMENGITWGWIRKYHWILKRVLLDIDFEAAIPIAVEGNKLLNEKVEREKKKMDVLIGLVENIKTSIESLATEGASVQKLIDVYGVVIESVMKAEKDEGFLEKTDEWIHGDDDLDTDSLEYRRNLEIEKLARIEEKLKADNQRLAKKQNALDRAVEQYNQVLTVTTIKKNMVLRFIEHLYDNIIYYMQAIWAHENPDQRYMRLFSKDVVFIDYPEDDATVLIREVDSDNIEDAIHGGVTIEVILPEIDEDTIVSRKLEEIANLDNLLGFKGNYMIFPLKEQSYITAYMMQSYLNGFIDDLEGNLNRSPIGFGGEETDNPHLHLSDPDNSGITISEIEEAISILAGDENRDVRVKLEEFLEKIKLNQNDSSEHIIVPSDNLYVEALPGFHGILEKFKEQHRHIDVLKAKEELRQEQLETIRLEGLLLSEQLDDPQIDKNILINSNVPVNPSVDVIGEEVDSHEND